MSKLNTTSLYIAVLIVWLTLYPMDAVAQVPNLINFQAQVQVDGCETAPVTRDIIFAIYDTETIDTGTSLWSETHTGYEITNCEVMVQLGSVEAFNSNVFGAEADRWLQIDIGSEKLSPRFRITSSGYALHADYAEQSRRDFVVNGFLKVNLSDFELGLDDGRDRGASERQRAMVHLDNDQLWINYANDFEGGTKVGSSMEVFGSSSIRGPIDEQGNVESSRIDLIGLDGSNNTGIEIRSNQTAFVDFADDESTDFDVRLRLSGDDFLIVDGGNLEVTEGNIITSGAIQSGAGQPFMVRYGTESQAGVLLNGNTGTTYREFDFGHTFSTPPTVIITGQTVSGSFQGIIASATEVSTSNFKLHLFNSTSGQANGIYVFSWMAMGN